MNRARDYKIAFGIGVASSVLWFFALGHLGLLSMSRLLDAVIAIPLLFILGVALAQRFFKGHIFHKIVKFLIVGVLNTGIDFFVFNALIILTGIDSGAFVVLFKSISFIFAIFNSYELNRLWTFDDESAPVRNKQEFIRFVTITVASFLVNVGTTTVIANMVHPIFGMSQVRWDNVAAAIATLLNFILNFTGYKLFVFTSTSNAS